MIGVKDSIPHGLHKCVVYKFLCVGCNACYVSKTSWHLCFANFILLHNHPFWLCKRSLSFLYAVYL